MLKKRLNLNNLESLGNLENLENLENCPKLRGPEEEITSWIHPEWKWFYYVKKSTHLRNGSMYIGSTAD